MESNLSIFSEQVLTGDKYILGKSATAENIAVEMEAICFWVANCRMGVRQREK